MDGWMGEEMWMGEWVDGQVDGWIEGRVDRGRKEGWLGGLNTNYQYILTFKKLNIQVYTSAEQGFSFQNSF